MNDVIPAGAVNVSAAIYDVQGENDSKESSLLQIKYVADELEFCVDCYDMGSIEKIVAKNSGKIIYANENNEHFEKYVQRRNWFAWMISPGNASSRSGKLLYD